MSKTTNVDLVVFAVRKIQESNRYLFHMPAVADSASVMQIQKMFPHLRPILSGLLDKAVKEGRLEMVRCINLDRYIVPNDRIGGARNDLRDGME